MLSNITHSPCENYLLYATQKGHVVLCDRRNDHLPVRKLRDSIGSLRDVQCCGKYILTLGLDRFLRVYDDVMSEEGGLKHKVYLKQKLNRALVTERENYESEQEEEESESEEEEREVKRKKVRE